MKKSYHLVLSGGGVRGLAHIGMYKALVEKWYTISRVSGTSAGSLVGLFIAAGKTPAEIEEVFTNYSIFNLLKPSFSPAWLFAISIIEEAIRTHISYTDLSELPIPLRVCVSDIDSAEPLYYEKGDILRIITASCSIPGIFKPVIYDSRHLVDGGLYDNFPIPLQSDLPIIGCHVNPLPTKKCRTTKDIAIKSIQILVNRDISMQRAQCKIFLEPPALASIEQSPFVDKAKIIKIGYEYAMKKLDS